MLIPEVVKRGDLEIGRFEVTRAQFTEFDKNYKLDAGTENYPANGITLDHAKAYAAWLSKTDRTNLAHSERKRSFQRCTKRKTAKTRSTIGPDTR